MIGLYSLVRLRKGFYFNGILERLNNVLKSHYIINCVWMLVCSLCCSLIRFIILFLDNTYLIEVKCYLFSLAIITLYDNRFKYSIIISVHYTWYGDIVFCFTLPLYEESTEPVLEY